MKHLKIGTWNLRHGGGKRISGILEAISENNEVDIFVFTEFRNNQNKLLLESALSDLGYRFIKTVSFEIAKTLNSVLVASKIDFTASDFSELEEHKQRVLKIKLAQFTIYACYFPLDKVKKSVFDFLLKEIQENGTENLIIAGDINTGKHLIDETGKTFIHAAYLDKFEENGLIDAWRKVHNDKKEYSWFSNVGNGFRIDHFFVDKNLSENIISCEYVHTYRENKVSDHSMMILKLEI